MAREEDLQETGASVPGKQTATCLQSGPRQNTFSRMFVLLKSLPKN